MLSGAPTSAGAVAFLKKKRVVTAVEARGNGGKHEDISCD